MPVFKKIDAPLSRHQCNACDTCNRDTRCRCCIHLHLLTTQPPTLEAKSIELTGNQGLCVYWVAATAKLSSPLLPETVVKRSVRLCQALCLLGRDGCASISSLSCNRIVPPHRTAASCRRTVASYRRIVPSHRPNASTRACVVRASCGRHEVRCLLECVCPSSVPFSFRCFEVLSVVLVCVRRPACTAGQSATYTYR